MLNKYNKLYQDLIDKFAELHNAHMELSKKKTKNNFNRIRKAIAAVKEHTDPLRKCVMDLQREEKAYQRQLWLDRKAEIREEKQKKLERKLRKQNDNTSSN